MKASILGTATPTHAQPSMTQGVRHHHVTSSAPTADGNYWLEVMDPKHRAWAIEGMELFDNWLKDTSTRLGFFDWIEKEKLGADLPQVKYLKQAERSQYQIFIGKDGYLYKNAQAGTAQTTPQMERYTTKGLSSAHGSGVNVGIWVCSPTGTFYAHQNVVALFHHSSFLAGGRVLSAGEWIVSAGTLLLISHETGHYMAPAQSLLPTLRVLEARGADLARTVVRIANHHPTSPRISCVRATDFLRMNGQESQCKGIEIAGETPDMTLLAADLSETGSTWPVDYLGLKPPVTRAKTIISAPGDPSSYLTD